MENKIPTLRDVYLAGKTVIVRCGFDVPLDKHGTILDNSRIKLCAPTINYLLEHKVKQIIIITHLGRPKGNEDNLKTFNVSLALGDILGQDISYINSWDKEDIPDDAKIVMLENLRFNDAEKSKDPTKRDEFGKQLASLADIYVNDAFSVCHRNHASMTSIPKFIPGFVGNSVEFEINTITQALSEPKRPFISIIGGVKADKLTAIENLLERVDKILVGGALGFTLLKYFGSQMGTTKTDMEGLEEFKPLLDKIKNNPKVWLPTDAITTKEFSNDAESKIASTHGMNADEMALDIGPTTIESYKKEIEQAGTIIWNGPIGVFEFENFANGTKEIANSVANNKGITIIGGGDSASAVHSLKLENKFTLVSSGGGASLKLFENKPLIAIEALKK